MVNALVIRRNTQLAKAQKALRAAQYVRMSTELQRYSIQNQAATIAAYAQQRNLTIVRTYVDEGRSGFRIKGTPGFIELIEDVQSGNQTLVSSIQNQAADDVTAISFAVVAVFATDKGGGGVFHAAALSSLSGTARDDPDLRRQAVAAAAPWLHPTARASRRRVPHRSAG